MEQLILHIRSKVEQLLQTKVDHIEKIDHVPNNSVFKIVVKSEPYIFKIYKQETWPEDGKLTFINQLIFENHVGKAMERGKLGFKRK